MNTSQFAEFVKEKTEKFKNTEHEFNSSYLATKFIPHFRENYRIQVKGKYGDICSGYVGITTGWAPCFLLVYNSRSLGSTILLNDDYEIIKIYKGGRK